MAEAFDPSWEYYTGDPEVEEILSGAARVDGFESLPTGWDTGDNQGLRFGTGRPDKNIDQVCRERGKPEASQCGMCYREFAPARSGQSFCGRRCAVAFAAACRPQNAAVDRTPRPCPCCDKFFTPHRPGRRTCSESCGNAFRTILARTGSEAERLALEAATGKAVPACRHCRGILPPHKRMTKQVKLYCSLRCCNARQQAVARARKRLAKSAKPRRANGIPSNAHATASPEHTPAGTGSRGSPTRPEPAGLRP